MEKRKIIKTDILLTTLGFGGGPIGNYRSVISDKEAYITLKKAWDFGIRYYDTAPLYGHGLSEKRLGNFLNKVDRKSIIISTKVGRLLRKPKNKNFNKHDFRNIPNLEVFYDYSRKGTILSIQESLKRLKTDYIDIIFIHDIDYWTHGKNQNIYFDQALNEAYRELENLKSKGTIRAIGIAVNDWNVCKKFASLVSLDCILLAGRYTLLEQKYEKELLSFCDEKNISVIIGGPFNSGILATGPTNNSFYNYSLANKEIISRVKRIQSITKSHGISLTAAALQFPLRGKNIASVIPGLININEVTICCNSINENIPEEMWNTFEN